MNKTFFSLSIFAILLLSSNVLLAQPAAKNDNVAITPGVKTFVDVLANDNLSTCSQSEIEATMVITSPPSKGTAVKEGGMFYYTPNATAVGTDDFTYKITCKGVTSTATVIYKWVLSPEIFYQTNVAVIREDSILVW